MKAGIEETDKINGIPFTSQYRVHAKIKSNIKGLTIVFFVPKQTFHPLVTGVDSHTTNQLI